MKITNLLFLLLLVASCTENQQNTKPSPNGYWQQLGYGKIMQIRNDSIREYDICKAGCNLYDESALAEIGKIDSYSKDSLTIRKNLKTYKFVRIQTLPALCTQKNKATDPIHNFEVLWNTFNEHYCYFEERNIDWKAVYQTYKPKITAKTSDLELYQIFDDMLSSLNDGHVNLEMPDQIAAEFKRSEKIKKEQNPTKEKPVNKIELGRKTQSQIANFYCEKINSHNVGFAKWGMMKDQIAYVQINAMLFLAYYDIPKNLTLNEWGAKYHEIGSKRVFQRQDEIDGAIQLMETIINDIKDAKAVVLDLRFNFGGKDEVALEIIGHFINKQILISRKKAKLNNGFTNHQTLYLEPKKPSFLGEVYVLTSHETASAAELASLATLLPKNITRIGSNTEGIFSDSLDKRLPNGWEYTLSNEIYEDTKGNSYEGIGVPPDIRINYPKETIDFYNSLLKALSEGGDQAIEKVFQLQKQ